LPDYYEYLSQLGCGNIITAYYDDEVVSKVRVEKQIPRGESRLHLFGCPSVE
jgi:hypothetical protein